MVMFHSYVKLPEGMCFLFLLLWILGHVVWSQESVIKIPDIWRRAVAQFVFSSRRRINISLIVFFPTCQVTIKAVLTPPSSFSSASSSSSLPKLNCQLIAVDSAGPCQVMIAGSAGPQPPGPGLGSAGPWLPEGKQEHMPARMSEPMPDSRRYVIWELIPDRMPKLVTYAE